MPAAWMVALENNSL